MTLKKLNKKFLPVGCDEGVYAIAREIIMARPEEFKGIVLVLESFHLTKVVLGCIGKYLAGGGADTIMVESDVFGPNVVNSVMNGSHYVRSVKGMFSLYEAMRRLQWESFFTQNEYTQYTIGMEVIKSLKEAVADKDKKAS